MLGRTYFRPEHLLIASNDEKPVGFVHVGFSPRADGSSLDPTQGVISALFVKVGESFSEIGSELLSRAERLLRAAGATHLSAGGSYPVDPFYWGLYGGPLSAGVPVGDTSLLELLRNAGFAESRRFLIWERALGNFRPPVDRSQLQLKRRYTVEAVNELPLANWWQACAFSHVERARYSLRATDGSPVNSSLTFWDTQPLGERQGKRVVGLFESQLASSSFDDGVAMYLLGDSLRQFHSLGISHVEAVTGQEEVAWTKLFSTLGFQEVAQSLQMEKSF